MDRRLFPAACVMALLLVAGCSSDPTTSDEYAALQAERNDLAGELESAEAERDRLAAEVTSLQGEVDGQQSELERLQSENESLVDSVADADAQLAALEASTAAWPQEMKDLFLEGCVQDPIEGVTVEEVTALCGCVTDEMEKELTLTEFFTLSLALADPGVELDPITGFPKDMPDDLAEAIFQAMSTCMF